MKSNINKTLQDIKNFIFKNILYLILSGYLAYMFGFYFFSEYIFPSIDFTNGYIFANDTPRYIDGAKKIINLELPQGKGSNFLGYIFFIAFFEYFNLNMTYVVISQIFLTFLSSLCIYRISKKFSSHIGGIFCLSLYLFYLPIQMWNFYILTETIFICSIIFVIYFFIFLEKKYLPILIFMIFFTLICRPHGIILLPSLSLSILIWLYFNNKIKTFYLCLVGLIIISYPVLILLNYYLENQNIISWIVKTGIIFGYENKNNYLDFKIPVDINNNISSLILFYFDNMFVFILSFFKKIWFFFTRMRPFHSDFHFYYLMTYNLIYFPLSIVGAFKLYKKNNLGITLMFFLIIFFAICTGFTYADYDARFSLYILPLIFIFASVGFISIKNLIITKFSKFD